MGPRRNLLQRSRYQGPDPWSPVNCGKEVRAQGKETTLINKLDTCSQGEEAHLESRTNSIIIHFTIITFMNVTTVERSNGVQGRRCLFLDNKGNLWADVSTCS